MNAEILNAIENGKVAAIIPARSGSKGVKNKNIRCLKGYPMMAYSIAAAKMSGRISRVIVSTDSEEYAAIARYYGAETPFIRPKELASDRSTDLEFMQHAINWLYENEHALPEFFVHLRPTYPLRSIDIIDEAVALMQEDPSAFSLRSAHVADVSPFKWFRKTEDGYFRPMFDNMSLDDANMPRQAFPPVYIPDGCVDVLRTGSIVKTDLLHGDKMIGYVVDDGVDVDTLKDMEKLERLIETADLPLVGWLKEHFKTLEEAGF